MRGRHNHRLRRLGELALDAAMLKGLIARWSYRCGLHGRLGVTRYDVGVTREKGLITPLTAAFASDFHAGPTTHPGIFSSLFDALAEIQPDVLLLGGDFVSCKADYADELTDGLGRCQPPFGKYAVFGNHDLWVDDAKLTRLLTAAGVEVLVNCNIALAAPFDRISVCGVDDPWTGSPDVLRAFNGAKEIRIFLAHSPDGLLLLGNESFDVAFAGHTHGGQVALRDGTPILLPHGPLSRKYVHGKFPIDGNGHLIVSRGVGCSTLPIRVNADPELVVCTIRTNHELSGSLPA
jgi:predicted MPP superfamily phosphohydrolase